MNEVFMDALIDSLKLLPLLLVIYFAIAYFEFKMGSQLTTRVKKVGKAGPALGALFGLIPHGFSVVFSTLYSKRLITVGTLLAVYLSTSDEAIPVILAQPEKIGVLLPLLSAKIGISVIAGYSIDLVLSRSGKPVAEREVCAGHVHPDENSGHDTDSEWGRALREHPENEHMCCCGHSCVSETNNMKQLVVHPLIHTMKVFGFIFAVNLLLNFIIFRVGEGNLGTLFVSDSVLQPVIVALIGLIPNCAASVAVTEIYLKGGISFGSAVAGLSSGTGLGMIVLFKENRNIRENTIIIGLLFGISVAAGIILQVIYG